MVSGFCQPFLRPASPPSLAQRQRGRSEVGREVPSFPNRKSTSRPPHTGTGRQTTQRGTRPCLLSPLQNWRSENRRKKWKGIRPITQESRELRNNVLPFPGHLSLFCFPVWVHIWNVMLLVERLKPLACPCGWKQNRTNTAYAMFVLIYRSVTIILQIRHVRECWWLASKQNHYAGLKHMWTYCSPGNESGTLESSMISSHGNHGSCNHRRGEIHIRIWEERTFWPREAFHDAPHS